MPFPGWMARVNKRFTNKLLIRLSTRPPFAALNHVGRSSAKEYRIPINAVPTEDGFMIALTYGSGADWVKNVLAAGTAKLEYGEDEITLSNPRIVPRSEGVEYFSTGQRGVLRLLMVTEFLHLDR